jgi:phosphate:Na+ symporter
MTLIFIGAVIFIFFKSSKYKNIGYVILGLGVLFFGITIMSDAMRPLRGSEAFQEFLAGFTNPVLALLAGFIITAIIQSSTATTAILVTMLAGSYNDYGVFEQGMPIPFVTVAFVLLGVNIGTSLTTVLASIPANRESKRAAVFHITYDIIGSLIFGSLILIFPGILNWFTSTWAGNPAQQAAMFHTIYNVSIMLILLPFVGKIAFLMKKIIPTADEKTSTTHEKKLIYLEPGMSPTPSMAVYNAHMEICRMGQIATENFNTATHSFFNKEENNLKSVTDNEKVIDFLNHKITANLAKINRMTLSPQEANKLSKMFLVLSDIERIGDHAVNIADYTKTMLEEKRNFSETALEELKKLTKSTSSLIARSIKAFDTQDPKSLNEIKSSEKRIDNRRNSLRVNQINRCKYFIVADIHSFTDGACHTRQPDSELIV